MAAPPARTPLTLDVLGGDPGGGVLAEVDVEAEGGEVAVAGLGLEFGGGAGPLGLQGLPVVSAALVTAPQRPAGKVGTRGSRRWRQLVSFGL